MAEPGAVTLFDLDGTLYRGRRLHVALDLPFLLHQRGLFSETQLAQIDDLYYGYVTGRIARDDFAARVLIAYFRGVSGKSRSDVQAAAAEELWSLDGAELWFPYSLELAKLMASKTTPVLVSGSPRDALGPAATKLGIDPANLFGSTGGLVGDRYSGSVEELATRERKALFVDRFLGDAGRPFDPGRSFAFGDSVGDIPLLLAVVRENRFALTRDCRRVPREMLEEAEVLPEHVLEYGGDVLGPVRKRLEQILS